MVEAYKEGTLSPESMDSLTSIPDIGKKVGIGLGDSVGSASLLVTIMPDDSNSIRFAEQEQSVCDGHNLMLSALRDMGEDAGALVHTRYLNGFVLNEYAPAAQAQAMDASNYSASYGTPLYDQTVVLLGTIIARWRETSSAGGGTRTFTLIITDGEDAGSVSADAAAVKWLVSDLLTTGDHIVAGFGIENGRADFRAIFEEMGIPANWVLTAASTTDDIARVFRRMARSVQLAASSAESFRQLTAGPPTDGD